MRIKATAEKLTHLHVGELDKDDVVDEARHRRRDDALVAAEHDRLEARAERAARPVARRGVGLRRAAPLAELDRPAKGGLEAFRARAERAGREEVKQREQLVEAVLHRRACGARGEER